mmetsp:Transcript_102933/g.295129  ORF Transcript_102933/g.295129 Transcript_102933/m.295129 type:complete len:259 (-) Transcript_102933:1479-2255(-)
MDRHAEEWLWQRTVYSSNEQKAAWEDHYARRMEGGQWDDKRPVVSWAGSAAHGLGPWHGDGLQYFHSQSHWGSQWHPSTFASPQGLAYSCAEQWMMHQKALLFGDEAAAERIMATDDPAQQKCTGKQVVGFDDGVWNANCREVAYFGNLLKFSQNADMRRQLLATGDQVLAEAAENDAIWGIGMSERDARQLPVGQALHHGHNLLGEALMRVREEMLYWEVSYAGPKAARSGDTSGNYNGGGGNGDVCERGGGGRVNW